MLYDYKREPFERVQGRGRSDRPDRSSREQAVHQLGWSAPKFLILFPLKKKKGGL